MGFGDSALPVLLVCPVMVAFAELFFRERGLKQESVWLKTLEALSSLRDGRVGNELQLVDAERGGVLTSDFEHPARAGGGRTDSEAEDDDDDGED